MNSYRHLALAFVALLVGCGGSQSNDPPPVARAETKPIASGQTGKANSLDFTVTSIDQPAQIGPSGVGLKAEAGETFVVVSYSLKNTGDGPLPLMERPTLSLIDGSGTTYAPDETASMMPAGLMNDPSGMAADLNPNVSAKTKAAWKVDKNAFDRATWTLAVAADPTLTFALK